MDLLFRNAGAGDTATIEGLKAYAQNETETFKRRLGSWKKLVAAEANRHHFIESMGTKMMAVNIVAAGAVILAGILLLANGMIAGLVALAGGGTQLALSGLFKRRSLQGALQFKQWAAFRRFLRDFSRLKDAPVGAIEIWEHYLVYAVTLGVAKEVIDQLRVVLPRANETGLHYNGPAWLDSGLGVSGLERLDSLNTALSSMVGSASSAVSSGAGGGGGFSGGGGGGGGGGAG